MYERVYNPYHNRLELEAPFTRMAADKQRKPRRRLDRARTYIATLMYTR